MLKTNGQGGGRGPGAASTRENINTYAYRPSDDTSRNDSLINARGEGNAQVTAARARARAFRERELARMAE